MWSLLYYASWLYNYQNVQKSFHDPGHVSELPVATYETQLNVVHYIVHKTTTAALHNKKR